MLNPIPHATASTNANNAACQSTDPVGSQRRPRRQAVCGWSLRPDHTPAQILLRRPAATAISPPSPSAASAGSGSLLRPAESPALCAAPRPAPAPWSPDSGTQSPSQSPSARHKNPSTFDRNSRGIGTCVPAPISTTRFALLACGGAIGSSLSSRRVIPSSAASAESIVTPGASRISIWNSFALRWCSTSFPNSGASVAGTVIGTNSSDGFGLSAPSNFLGVTPTIVAFCPFSLTVSPIASGSAFIRLRQKRSLITTAGVPPVLSRSAFSSRPRCASIPSTEK